MAVEAEKKTGKKTVQGRVVSDKTEKTIVVLIEGRQVHTLYRKYVNISKKVKAHDENNEANVGDLVRVVEARPISRDKSWRLLEILERAR
jgi:small subunit ribosomal protein S17